MCRTIIGCLIIRVDEIRIICHRSLYTEWSCLMSHCHFLELSVVMFSHGSPVSCISKGAHIINGWELCIHNQVIVLLLNWSIIDLKSKFTMNCVLLVLWSYRVSRNKLICHGLTLFWKIWNEVAILLDCRLKTIEILFFSMLENLDSGLMSFTHVHGVSGLIFATASNLKKIGLKVVHRFFFSSSFISVDSSCSHTHFHKPLSGIMVISFILMIHFLDLPISRNDVLHHHLLSTSCDIWFSFLS